jgi:hypothetical protein
MAFAETAPDINNYFIAKGYVKFSPDGGATWTHLGNAPEVEWSPNLDMLDHFSAMAGVRSKDRKVIREKSATVRIVLEESNPFNLGLALMGDVTAGVAPAPSTIDIFSLAEITGALLFVGQNDVGPRTQYYWPNVSITPSGSINLISEEWASMEITAEVLVDPTTGSFGTATWDITDEVTPTVTTTTTRGAPRTRVREAA